MQEYEKNTKKQVSGKKSFETVALYMTTGITSFMANLFSPIKIGNLDVFKSCGIVHYHDSRTYEGEDLDKE